MNVSEYIVNFFLQKGIDTTFMLTGGHSMHLNDAVSKLWLDKKMNVICPHHEQAAAMEADGYARIAGKPALVIVTAGPGATNILTGVTGAYTDSTPVIVLTGQSHTAFLTHEMHSNIRQHGTQGVNITDMAASCTKYFSIISDVKSLRMKLETAYHSAVSGRPGPVWLDVPLDIQRMEVDENILDAYVSESYRPPTFTQPILELYQLLSRAQRPLFVLGQGVRIAKIIYQIQNFLEKNSIPFVVSRMGIDLIPHSHPCYTGQLGVSGERPSHFAVQNADLIVILGSRLASPTVGHNPKEFGKHAVLYAVDIDEEELNKPNVALDYKVQGDLGIFFTAFESSCGKLPQFKSWLSICQSWREKYPVVLSSYKDEEKINSYYLVDRLSYFAKEGATIVTDGGSSFYVTHQAWKAKNKQRLITSCSISAMGGWCMGIGASIANLANQTLIITGDGGLQLNIQEFATIKHYNTPVKIFIINNNGYLAIRHTQRNFMEGRLVGESPQTGVWCPDALEIAKAYGIKGIRIHNTDELDEKIKEALAYQGPVIVDVLSPEWQVLQPKLASDKLPDGSLVAKPFEDLFPFLSPEELASNMLPPLERLK